MKLLILGTNLDLVRGGVENYRGTHRSCPSYCEDLPKNHEVNRLFSWYLAEGGESGVVSDLQKAKALVQAYRRLLPPQEYEIVEAVMPGEAPRAGCRFLGLDLSCGLGYSLLYFGLKFPIGGNVEADLRRIEPLSRLCMEHFQPRLNQHGLFEMEKDARFCLECLMALQAIRPGLFENEEHSHFEVVGLYLVDHDKPGVL